MSSLDILPSPIKAWARSYFLPVDYPESVSEDYISYQVWDTLQGLMAYLKGVLVTLAFLKGLGVGSQQPQPMSTDASSTPIAQSAQQDQILQTAMMAWMVRDLTSMLAGLFFGAPRFTKHFASLNQLKRWRLVSESLSSIAGMVELYAAEFSGTPLFLIISCCSRVFSAAGGTIGSCTRSSVCQHLARRNNLADCSAKEGNQDRAVKVLGIIFAYYGLQYLHSVKQQQQEVTSDSSPFYFSQLNATSITWMVYSVLSALHFLFNILAMKVLNVAQVLDGKKID